MKTYTIALKDGQKIVIKSESATPDWSYDSSLRAPVFKLGYNGEFLSEASNVLYCKLEPETTPV